MKDVPFHSFILSFRQDLKDTGKSSTMEVMKKKGVRLWKKKVWKVFSDYIRERDNWTCITCKKVAYGQKMHAGHFVPRAHSSTFLDEKNVHAQCCYCNTYGNGEPHIYAAELVSRYGQEEFEALIKRGREIKRFTVKELEDLYNKYK